MLRRVVNSILLLPLTLSFNTVYVLSSETKNYIDNVLEEKSNITFLSIFYNFCFIRFANQSIYNII